ncbi:MAG: Asp-tRNA(Asn)/Glu-tRNA(Gln) amidotransferase subunit GatA [Deltaproteobacteria bacterium]|nr:Asp-tRNA(Asn)/Glu-tRNA(Gln) amidotransferase subunit GatA [Deltaproteobacteria bacterium]
MDLYNNIKQIHEAYNKKLLSPIELTKGYFQKIKASKHNAYLTLCEERATQQAKKADQILAQAGQIPHDRFPLLGIPIGIKDVLTIEGVRTTCASRMLEHYIPPYTATSVLRLETAGAIVLGKLNMDEFAMGSSNENSAFGPVLHPTHHDRVPGGSSGGSATAVKAGLCVAALGTDTGGSVRLPASYCGIVGMKPTYGTVSRFGLVAFASSLDQVGPLANTVEDVAKLLDVMAGHDPSDSTSLCTQKVNYTDLIQTTFDLKNLKIGVPNEYFMGGLQPGVDSSVHSALKWCETQGAKLISVNLPHTKYAVAVYYIIAVSEASSNLARYDSVRFGVRHPGKTEQDLVEFYKKARSLFGAEVKRRIILGTFSLSSGYYDAYYKRACQVRRLIQQDFDKAFNEVDVILSPVSPTTAFKIGEKTSDPLQMYLMDIFTIPVNLAGLPALSVPCGKDNEGLPVGLHMIGPAFGDGKLLAIANAFEKGFTINHG